MKRLVLGLCCLLFLAQVAWAESMQDVEKAMQNAQTAFEENRLDDTAREFTRAAEILAGMKRTDNARAIYGNVAIVRMQQERWQDALDVYAAAAALPGKAAPDFLLQMAQNSVVCAENLHSPLLKAKVIESLFSAKVKLSAADKLNFLAMQGDAYRAAELYSLACKAYDAALKDKALEPERRVAVLIALGRCRNNLGQSAKALQALEIAQKEAQTLNAGQALVESVSNMGIIYLETGQYDKAAACLQTAIERAREFNLRGNEGADNNNLGLVYKSAGNLTEASGYINTALNIARETGERRDEAIALSNKALLERMAGKNDAAREDYAAAIALYKEVGFRKGEAAALVGLGRLEMLANKNYPAALEKFQQAEAIYKDLDNPGLLAECYGQMGELYQRISTPKRKTRDLVFDDTEAAPTEMSPQDALAKSVEYYSQALPLAEKTGRREVEWGALQGLAFAARENGDLPRSEELYARAVEIVLSLKGGKDSSDLLQNFLYATDDLFAQAMDVCAKLYAQTQDPALLVKQMMYDEILRNEVMRANMQAADLKFEDPVKQAAFEVLTALAADKEKAAAAAATAATAAEGGDETARSESLIASQDASAVAKEFEAKLALWKKNYPQDAVLFDSMAAVDTVKLQAGLGPDQAIVQYIPLEESLVILTITKEEVAMTSVDVTYEDMASLIRDKLIAENIEKFGHSNRYKNIDTKAYFEQSLVLMKELAAYLYEPVKAHLQNKEHLYFLTSKYLSYVPFAALVVGEKDGGGPEFLIEQKTISLARLSFLQQALAQPKDTAPGHDLIVVGDPQHKILEIVLPRLEGAEVEAENAGKAVGGIDSNAKVTILTAENATKSTWKTDVGNHQYSIMYFATHGVPFAEIKSDFGKIRKGVLSAEDRGEKTYRDEDISLWHDFITFYDTSFKNNSHLNGFLFFAYPDGNETGILTLREILELPDSVFAKADLAVLSACNTAVSYSPKVVKNKDIHEDLEDQRAAEELVAAGWTPGVDQVCLVDTFFKRNFRNVYGTLWFADDIASSFIMSAFIDNLKTMTPAKALRSAQLAYLSAPPHDSSEYPQHPFFWACGNIFGQ